MKFIPLTHEIGDTIFVNFNHIVLFEPHSQYTLLRFSVALMLEEEGEEKPYWELVVLETPEEIMALLESKD